MFFPGHFPGSRLPDSHFTPVGTDTHRLIYRGSVIEARGAEVAGVTGCICRPGCPNNLYRLTDGRTLGHTRPTSVEWEERPEPDEAERALLLALLGREA